MTDGSRRPEKLVARSSGPPGPEVDRSCATLPGVQRAQPLSLGSETPAMSFAPRPPGARRGTLTVLDGARAGDLVPVPAEGMVLGRAAEADLVLDDAGVSRRHARVAATSEGVFYVEDLGSTNGTFIGAERVGLSFLRWGDLLQLGPQMRLRFALAEAAEESLHRDLYESSTRDALTRVHNRRYFSERLVAEIARVRLARTTLSLLLADVDRLKQVNDRYGHLAGDRLLALVAARIQGCVRGEDVVARYGGDEFVVLASGLDDAATARLAERIRKAVEGLRLAAREESVPITLSIGVASLGEVGATGDPVAELVARADQRMYAAKAAGRNGVALA